MSEPIEPPPEELAKLYRSVPPSPAHGLEDRLWQKLATRLPPAPGSGPGGAAGSGGALGAHGLKLAGAALIAGLAGGYAVKAMAPSVIAPIVIVVDRPVPVPAEPQPEPTPAAAPAPVPRPAKPRPPEENLATERLLLEKARSALIRGDAAGALEAVKQHGREFPRGALEEEREALWIQCDVKLGNFPSARARAAVFTTRWPDSFLRSVIDASLASEPAH